MEALDKTIISRDRISGKMAFFCLRCIGRIARPRQVRRFDIALQLHPGDISPSAVASWLKITHIAELAGISPQASDSLHDGLKLPPIGQLQQRPRRLTSTNG